MKTLLLFGAIALSINVFGQVPSYVPANGLVGYWGFNGNANDESVNTNDGVVNGATLTTDRFGTANAAYSFDGVSSHIVLDKASNIFGADPLEWSISAWYLVNQHINGESDCLISDYSGPVSDDNTLSFQIEFNGTDSTQQTFTRYNNNSYYAFDLNGNSSATWHHLTAVFSKIDSNICLYDNGILIDEPYLSPSYNYFTDASADIHIGRRAAYYFNLHHFYGFIDDIGFWNRALTQCEISALYHAQTLTPPLVALGADTSICLGDSVILDAGAGYDAYTWSTGETTQTIYAAAPGTYSATVGFETPVQNNYTMEFDGNNSPFIEIPDNSDLNNLNDKLTIMAWVKPLGDINGENPRIVDRSEGNGGGTDRWFLNHTSSNNLIQFGVGQGATESVNGTSSMNNGSWQFVTVVYDAGNVVLYLNGIADGTGSISINSLSHVQNIPMNIGGVNGNNSFWNGSLDQISLWNTVLTQSEIQNYMNCPPTGNEAGLVGYWNFEEGSGTIVTDHSPNGNNGTISSAIYSNDIPEQMCIACTATDDVVVTEVTPSTSTDTQSQCDSYTWIDGNIYTVSNTTATHTLTNAAGCDSIVTLDLTITNSNTGTDVQTACNTYDWIDGNTYTSSNNLATHTLTNAAGCDSIVTLDLTVNYSNTGTDVQTACNTYDWIDGNTYTSSNNLATHTLTNAAGCDSIVTLDLTVNYSNTATDVQTACNTFDWIDGNTYTSSNNLATHTLTNVAGCDSVVTLDLTITNSNTGTDVQTACDSYTWIDGNTYTVSNNLATHTLTNAAGCDSVVTLDLTITPLPDNNVTQAGSLLTADQAGATYQWLDCDDNNAIINGENNQTYNPTVTGDYAVEITLNGCVDTSACFLVDYTGLSEMYAGIITIHPNPTSEMLIVSGLNEISGLKNMEITSSKGEVVMKINGAKEEINVSVLSVGVYFLNINHEKGVETIRFVKQ